MGELLMLTRGSVGPSVKRLQGILINQGYDVGSAGADGDFGKFTFAALQEFQGAHLGPDKKALNPTGIVDQATEWALQFPSGITQRSFIDPMIPSGLTPGRLRLLEFVVAKYRQGIHEVPDGSNGGDGVDEITGGRRAAWCMRFVWWCLDQLKLQVYPHPVWACIDAREIARNKGWWRARGAYSPKPGDQFIMLYSDEHGGLTGKGHTGWVLDTFPGGVITIEGNCGNRVACKRRSLGQLSLRGFINFWPKDEQPLTWGHGNYAGASEKEESTR